MLTTCRSPPRPSTCASPPASKLDIWYKNMRSVLTPMKKQFSDFWYLRYGQFCTQILRKLTKMSNLLSFASIFFTTRSKCVSKDSRRLKKVSIKKNTCNVCKKIKIAANFFFKLGVQSPGPGYFWIKSP